MSVKIARASACTVTIPPPTICPRVVLLLELRVTEVTACRDRGVIPVEGLNRRAVLALPDGTIAYISKDSFHLLFICTISPRVWWPSGALLVQPCNQSDGYRRCIRAAAEVVRFSRVGCEVEQAPRFAAAI